MNTKGPAFRPAAIAELVTVEGSASAFSRRAEIARPLVGAWLSGTVTPQVGTLTRLCRVFGVPIDFFFETVETADGDGVEDKA